jgi:sortase A
VVTVTTRAGAFRYRVVSVTVVQPDDTGVLDADQKQVLTLVTCYPFTFIGSAPERFVVRAERFI